MTSKGNSLILKTDSTKIRFDQKMANKSGKGFLLNTKFHKNANDTSIFASENRIPEENSIIQTEGVFVKKQKNMTTIKIATRKIHGYKLNAKIGYTRENKMCATTTNLFYSVKGMSDFCEDCATSESK